jgi:hypothetical protein
VIFYGGDNDIDYAYNLGASARSKRRTWSA